MSLFAPAKRGSRGKKPESSTAEQLGPEVENDFAGVEGYPCPEPPTLKLVLVLPKYEKPIGIGSLAGDLAAARCRCPHRRTDHDLCAEEESCCCPAACSREGLASPAPTVERCQCLRPYEGRDLGEDEDSDSSSRPSFSNTSSEEEYFERKQGKKVSSGTISINTHPSPKLRFRDGTVKVGKSITSYRERQKT